MPYTIPEFPLMCTAYNNEGGVPGGASTNFLGNLALGKRGYQQFWPWADDGRSALFAYLLCPSGTAVRDPFALAGPDFVEVATGSGRMYLVDLVDDIGAGFPNEHRLIVMHKYGVWPSPLPPIYVAPGPGRGRTPVLG